MLGLQIHFVATGKPEKCQRLRRPALPAQLWCRNVCATSSSRTTRFAIPPGAPAHKVAASRVLDRDIIGVGLFSHMHLRGKDMTFTAHLPDGKTDTLLIIPNYNFSWQIPYRWEPGKKQLPKGTRLECVAHYDNSPFNPYNPTRGHGPQRPANAPGDDVRLLLLHRRREQLGLHIDPKTGNVGKKSEQK